MDSPNPYENMSLEDIIISECTDESDETYFNNFISVGSSTRRRRRTHIDRGREDGHTRLFNDYFSEQPVYTDNQFRRRFRMHRQVFLRIVQALEQHSEYFQTRFDAVGRRGLSPLQKCTTALRMIAYGGPADYVDEYIRIGETTAIECLVNFAKGINEIFGAKYLRRPNIEDIRRLLQMGEARGFPGMLGSIDCMHWEWKNCPVSWKGQFTRGDHGTPTIMLEAVASQDLWIWHAFFGVPGSNNDLNVLNQSPLFTDVLQGQAPTIEFMVNGTKYNKGYYLADGIYPEWGTFVKTIALPQGDKRKLFAQCQEAVRKDVERAFGVLQSRFAIIRGPARFWQRGVLKDIMYACIILHNIIVEDERDTYESLSDFIYDEGINLNDASTVEISHGPVPDFAAMLQNNAEIRDRSIHRNLQADLIEHIWLYPKVKVRDEALDHVDEDDYTTRFYKALDALSLHDFHPPVEKLEDNSLPSVARVSKSYVSKPVMPMAPISRGPAKSINRKIVEQEKQNIRASSVPRPRAVLSSPDNDGILKSKEKSRPQASSGLKNHNQRQNRHDQCKVIPTSINAEGRPINKMRETNEAAHSRINPKVIRVSPSAEPNKRAYLRKGL